MVKRDFFLADFTNSHESPLFSIAIFVKSSFIIDIHVTYMSIINEDL